MDKRTFNPCDECKYGIDRRDGSGNDSMCKICEFNALLKLCAQPENEPLTLDELRQMGGEPVYCVDGAGNECWCVVNEENDDCIDNEAGAWVFSFYAMPGDDGLYGLNKQLGWLAYRRKLERSEGE